jgi:hypothetical protein
MGSAELSREGDHLYVHVIDLSERLEFNHALGATLSSDF